MEIYQLRYFAYAAKYENITMAAQELNVSQPSISKAIQSLERELKTELLRKNGRSCVLTHDGYLLQERVVPLLEEIEQLPLEFRNRQKKKLIRLRPPCHHPNCGDCTDRPVGASFRGAGCAYPACRQTALCIPVHNRSLWMRRSPPSPEQDSPSEHFLQHKLLTERML